MKLKLQFTANFARLLALILLLTLGSRAAWAQTTAFSYQGQLTDGGAFANGPYDLQFKLFDAATGGNQVGATLTRDDVNVANGAFSTSLDFGAAAFPGAARWLEISARQGASTGVYTKLTPRQPITSTPYATRSLSAETVTGNVPASQITGVLSPGALPPGILGSYIENTTTEQPASNFNISGNGTAAGTLSANVVNAATQYHLGSERVLSGSRAQNNLSFGWSAGDGNAGAGNSYFGILAGSATTTGISNSFFGYSSGNSNTEGRDNAFFGSFAGARNSTGSRNSMFGAGAGANIKTSEDNSYFGYLAGINSFGIGRNSFFGSRAGFATTTGYANSFFGTDAGTANTTGRANSFFGDFAGNGNTTGFSNTFVGVSAGFQHKTGDDNTFIGRGSGTLQTGGNSNTLLGTNSNIANGLSFATAIGAGATVSQSNTVVLGRSSDSVLIPNSLYISNTAGGINGVDLCIQPTDARVVKCGISSQRYKSNVESLHGGLNLVNRLRPVTFDWKEGGAHDVGFIAEEVAAIEPLLTFRNEKGEVEGVKYQLVSVILVNAVKEQQAQIEQLKKIVCANHPEAAVCKPKAQ